MTPRCITLTALLTVASASHAQHHTTWPPKLHLHRPVAVITLSEPGLRQPCYVAAIDANTLTCDTDTGRTIYPRTDVAALTELYKPWLPKAILASAVTGAVITGLVLNPLAVVVFGGIAAAIALHAVTDPFHEPLPPLAVFRERVLYQRPATPLSIDLDD